MIRKFAHNCPEYKQLQCNGATINVSIADTDARRSAGLSGVTHLGDNEGMLFVFSDRFERFFHMRDCHFDIEAIAIDFGGVVLKIAHMKMSNPTTMHTLPKCSRVLEVKSGFCEKNDIKPGDIICDID